MLVRTHSNTPHFIVDKDISSGLRDPTCKRQFGIRHYAGEVAYSVIDFVGKNKDDIHQNLQDLVAASTSTFVTDNLFFRAAAAPGDASNRRGAQKPISQVTLYPGGDDATTSCGLPPFRCRDDAV